MWPVGLEDLTFGEALQWFLDRVPMTAAEVAKLEQKAKRRAFFVSHVAEIDVVSQAWAGIEKALEKGQTLEEFRKEVKPKLEAAWAGSVANPAARVENIYRTNVQSAYAAGRYEQMTAPAVAKSRPYWEFSAVMDGRTSPVCAALDGTVLPADDPFWETRHEPLHYQCRSTKIALTEKQALAKGITATPPVQPPPLEGFGARPGEEWKPDVEKYPEPLREAAEKRLALAPEAPVRQVDTGTVGSR